MDAQTEDRLWYNINMPFYSKKAGIVISSVGLGAKLRLTGYFVSLLHRPKRKTWLLFSFRDLSFGLKKSMLYQIFCGQFSENSLNGSALFAYVP